MARVPPIGGRWRGIAHVPNGNLRLRDEWAHVDARRRFRIDLTELCDAATPGLAQQCICGDIMAGIASPTDCKLYGKDCVPDSPVGACMVSEGTCRIWQRMRRRSSRPVRDRRHLWSPAMKTLLADERILMKHGAGGRAMRRLIEEVLTIGLDGYGGPHGLAAMDDGAALRVGDRWLVLTTDSHVVHPIFFPGGDIGRLAVGTVNDLAMMGATEVLGLTCAVVIEKDLRGPIWCACRNRCARPPPRPVRPSSPATPKSWAAVRLDGLIVNTTGGAFTDHVVTDAGLQAGDMLLTSGTIGDHGFAVMTARHGFALEGPLASDVAPLNGLIREVLRVGGRDVVAMKDPTRGGLASTLHEMAAKAAVTIVLDERAVPVTDEARAVSELLGIDPLNVANEGKAIIGVRPWAADAVLAALRAHPRGRRAAVIGRAVEGRPSVVLDTGVGRRLLVEPEGEPLPRIC